MSAVQEENFRGLLYEPTVENEVIILFSLMIPYFQDRFVIDQYPDTFPDCEAKRNNKKILIEFETKASSFLLHRNNKKLEQCDLLICWKNNIRGQTEKKDGKDWLVIKNHPIEIMALDRVYDDLKKGNKCPKLILNGKRPSRGGANKEKFFKQLEQEIKAGDPEKYNRIEALFKWVNQREDFEVVWGGKKRFTMRFFMKVWDKDPVYVEADGTVFVCYEDNPSSSSYWKLPPATEDLLRKMFHHDKLNKKGQLPKWPHVAIETPADLENIKQALVIMANHSKHYDLIGQAARKR